MATLGVKWLKYHSSFLRTKPRSKIQLGSPSTGGGVNTGGVQKSRDFLRISRCIWETVQCRVTATIAQYVN